MIKALIIDDEHPAREIIKSYLKPHQDIKIAGECDNGFEGIKSIQELKPDIIFLDIQMPKLTGFEMLELLDDPPVIIFSTAYDEYAIKAFERNATDYLLKPFSSKRFDEALEKGRYRLKNRKPQGNATSEQSFHDGPLERIAIRNGRNIVVIPVEQIDYIEAQDDYVALYSRGLKYLKQFTMKYLEQALPSALFLRVHRSYIINLDQITKLETMTKDSYIAILKNHIKIPVSRSGYGELKKKLNI